MDGQLLCPSERGHTPPSSARSAQIYQNPERGDFPLSNHQSLHKIALRVGKKKEQRAPPTLPNPLLIHLRPSIILVLCFDKSLVGFFTIGGVAGGFCCQSVHVSEASKASLIGFCVGIDNEVHSDFDVGVPG
ncbi:hypothetical protein Taro_027618 [Colocasia esculenta]|uniref:Uncharacterized protein n=1 Tax=Colocasia esculenta TaxID=4460 RepID=A0A843VN05_COLES|nr:hypothetical protein [Colocasia esculenta]